MSTSRPLRVAMIGHGFMGAAHSQAWRRAVDLGQAIAAGEQPRPSFEDGLHVQRVLVAVERSAAADAGWTSVSDQRG